MNKMIIKTLIVEPWKKLQNMLLYGLKKQLENLNYKNIFILIILMCYCQTYRPYRPTNQIISLDNEQNDYQDIDYWASHSLVTSCCHVHHVELS